VIRHCKPFQNGRVTNIVIDKVPSPAYPLQCGLYHLVQCGLYHLVQCGLYQLVQCGLYQLVQCGLYQLVN